MNDWLDALSSVRLDGPCVLVSVARTRGSCPRETGTRMLVSIDTCHGTVGGGHLEYQAIALARDMLAASPVPDAPRLERFPLGARVGQCCGGTVHLTFDYVPADRPSWTRQLLELNRLGLAAMLVTRFESAPGPTPDVHDATAAPAPSRGNPGSAKRVVVLPDGSGGGSDSGSPDVDAPRDTWRSAEMRAIAMLQERVPRTTRWEPPFLYEPVLPDAFDITLFGAGHVGRALIEVLHTLPCSITWIDSRASEFPAKLPHNVTVVTSDRPEAEVADAPAGSQIVIMTHSHALDQAICERALRRSDLGWCGLIGSVTKRLRFEKRLLARGLTSVDVARLVCPIGVRGIDGKHPAEIAIAVAAEILRNRERRQAALASTHRAA